MTAREEQTYRDGWLAGFRAAHRIATEQVDPWAGREVDRALIALVWEGHLPVKPAPVDDAEGPRCVYCGSVEVFGPVWRGGARVCEACHPLVDVDDGWDEFVTGRELRAYWLDRYSIDEIREFARWLEPSRMVDPPALAEAA